MMIDKMPAWLSQWLALRDLPMAEIQRRCGLAEAQVKHDASYINLEHMTRLRRRASHPGDFYFDESGRLVLLYVERAAEFEGYDDRALRAALGEPATTLRARTGKHDTVYVYPDQGLAFAGSLDGIMYVEVFQPMTLADYLAVMYVDPGEFIR